MDNGIYCGDNKAMSLVECIKEILNQKKNSVNEWVTVMTVYDTIRLRYPAIAETIQLVDIREILTTSDWIEKEDIYFRLLDNESDEERMDIESTDNSWKEISIEELDLSVRSYNALKRAKLNTLGDLVTISPDELMTIKNLGQLSQREIIEKVSTVLKEYGASVCYGAQKEKTAKSQKNKVVEGRIIIDIPIEEMFLSVRSYNCLHKAGIQNISEIINWTLDDFMVLRNMGKKSALEILDVIQELYDSGQIIADVTEEEQAAALEKYHSTEGFKKKLISSIHNILNKAGFCGLDEDQIVSLLNAPVEKELVVSVLEEMINEGTIYNVDDSYIMKYPSVCEAIEVLPDKPKLYIRERLEGKTLKEIGDQEDLSRERVRQVISKGLTALKDGRKNIKSVKFFCEDEFQYLYENYEISRDEWLRIIGKPEYIFNYLQMTYKKGVTPLILALDDDRIDDEIKHKIKAKDDENYIIVGNRRICKNRKEIEEYILYQYFKDEGTVEDFFDVYNSFLEDNGIDDIGLYATDDVKRSRENSLSDSRKILWKQNRKLRYYNIDGTDFQELLDTLNLEQYENIEVSTLKFSRDYPELMTEYDIRDEYELHNLLKKICDPNDYNDIHFGRMPGITFGSFDREEAVRSMMYSLAPVSQDDLADAIFEKYGTKPVTVKVNWLGCVKEYFFNGMYYTEEDDDTALTDNEYEELAGILSDDFYFEDEVKNAYSKISKDDNKEAAPKPYVLKRMGFNVFSGYICRASKAKDFFLEMLTAEDIVDLSKYGSRMKSIMVFNQVECPLREEYELLEFEPYKYVNIRRLQSFGIEKNDITDYCKEVKRFVGKETYFTIPWLRKQGFTSRLDDLGFENFFYEAVLSLYPGIYSFINRTKQSGSALLKAGNEMGSKPDFIFGIIKEEGSIEKDDLIDYCLNEYNIIVTDHDIYNGMDDTDVYYDKIMGKFYANYLLYFDEI